MIGDTPLRKIVGADAFTAVARADQRFALGGLFGVLLAGLFVLDARGQHPPRLILVFVLRAAVLALDHNAGWQVGEAHRRIGLVDMLPAGAGSAEGINPHVRRIDDDITGFIGFGHDRHRGGGGVDASLRFGDRHALHPMPAGFKLQARVGTLADDAGDDFLVAADFTQGFGNDFDLPALAFGIAAVHAKQVAGKQRGFVAAGAAAHLNKNILVVVRVFGQQRGLQRVFDGLNGRFARLDFFLGKFAHVRVFAHFGGGLDVLFGFFVVVEQRHHRRNLGVLTGDFAVVVHVADHVGRGQQAIQIGQACHQRLQFLFNRCFHFSSSGSAGSSG